MRLRLLWLSLGCLRFLRLALFGWLALGRL